MNSFYASVEILERPELKNFPTAVCGDPENRHGIILAKNDEAKKFGVATAETIWQAKQKCPELQLLKPHMRKYKAYSDKINAIYARYTDMIEPFSIDESWLDVTGSLKLFGNGKDIGDSIRESVYEELGLMLSVGVSYNKIFAKMGSEYKKPDATTIITKSNFKEILWPMHVSKMFFVGSATADKLIAANINTIGDLANAKVEFLSILLGKQGEMLFMYANGLDNSPVCRFTQQRMIKSIGNSLTFSRDINTAYDIRTAVTALSDQVASRLRKHEIKASGIKIEIRDTSFHTISRQKQLSSPTNHTDVVYRTAIEIIKNSWRSHKPVRLLSVTAINLKSENEAANTQMSFLNKCDEQRIQKSENIDKAIDKIRYRFGNASITYGNMVDNDIGIDLDRHQKD